MAGPWLAARRLGLEPCVLGIVERPARNRAVKSAVPTQITKARAAIETAAARYPRRRTALLKEWRAAERIAAAADGN